MPNLRKKKFQPALMAAVLLIGTLFFILYASLDHLTPLRIQSVWRDDALNAAHLSAQRRAGICLYTRSIS